VTKKYPKPKAILIASAHWEDPVTTFVGASDPGLLYDYYGFPPEAYNMKYPAKFSTEILEAARKLLDSFGIQHRTDSKRAYDHVIFVPLKHMYPDADVLLVH
jgi:aromatic ring-opening dioxygenase catalytic subunit (LigB family)